MAENLNWLLRLVLMTTLGDCFTKLNKSLVSGPFPELFAIFLVEYRAK
jgi:hypothetical protein